MSSLYLRAEKKNDRTLITESSFTAPLKIAKPFYNGECTEVMLMSATPGMLEGDRYDILLEVGGGASLSFTGQSYTKIFRAEEKGASQQVNITLRENAFLLYRPMPVIPFADSVFYGNTQVLLSRNSAFVMYDIIGCGRAAMGEKYRFKTLRTRTSIKAEGRLVFLDNQRLVPEEAPLSGTGFFEGRTHIGMMYLYGFDGITLPESSSAELALSKAREGFCVRASADSADEILRCFDRIIKPAHRQKR